MSDSRSENTVAVVAHPEVNNYQEKTKKSIILKDEAGHPFRLFWGFRTTEEKEREKEAKKQLKERKQPGSSHDMFSDKNGHRTSQFRHTKTQKKDKSGRFLPPTGPSDIFHPSNLENLDSAGIPLDPMYNRYVQPGPGYVWSKRLHKWIFGEKGAKKKSPPVDRMTNPSQSPGKGYQWNPYSYRWEKIKIDPMFNPHKSPGKDYQWDAYLSRWKKIPKKQSSAPSFTLPKQIYCSYFQMYVEKSSHSKQCPGRMMYV